MSKILCIIDGMTDPSFRGEDYPNLSLMRRKGFAETCCGREPESLGCILRLLGVQKIPNHFRAYVEAVGNDIAVGSHDLVVRGSWFALDEQEKCIAPVDAPKALPQTADYRYYSLGQYKSIFVFPKMAGFVTDIVTYPPYAPGNISADHMRPAGCQPLCRAFDALKTDSRCMIPWGQAVSAELPLLPQGGAAVCAAPVVKGIAKLLGMKLYSVIGATGDTDTDLLAKSQTALQAAKENPFVLLHINGADEAAHRKDPEEKKNFLKKVDDIVLTMLLCSGNDVYVVADHGADPVTGKHLPGKQPVFTNVPDVTDARWKDAEKGTAYSKDMMCQLRYQAVELLRNKAVQLGRTPQKSDFDTVDVIKIKRVLGPWHRALEEAGLKERKPKRGGSSK